MTNLSPAQLRKYDWRVAAFVRKLKEKEPFEVKGGKKVVLVYVKGVENVLEKGSSKQVTDLRFTTTKGGVFKLSDIVKNEDFGGRGEGSGTVKEDIALAALSNQIEEAKKFTCRPEIIVRINGQNYNCAAVVSTPGNPKSDFHLVDLNGRETVWLSHKDGTTEKHFRQWGGMSASKEPEIFRHKESQKFIEDMKGMFPKGMPRATTVARKIKAPKLQMMAVYGNEFGAKFSRQNTTLMLQGNVELKKTGTKYTIEAHHTHVNGENMKGGYEPVFMAIYTGDRSDFGIKCARVGISPFGTRRITYMA